MTTDPLAGLRKQQRLCFGLALLTAFMAAMKVLGVFAVGTFPWYTEAALSAYMLIYGIYLATKIRKARANGEKSDAPANRR